MIANALSASRLAMVYPFVFLSLNASPTSTRIAAVIFVLAIVTDLLDGRVARYYGTESALGRALDHSADFLFVFGGLGAAAYRGLIPWALPVLIAVAFFQYVIDSRYMHGTPQLRMSFLGRWNGVLYFVPLGGVLLVGLGQHWLLPATIWCARLLILSTLLSIGDRLLALRSSRRKAPDSPDAGR